MAETIAAEFSRPANLLTLSRLPLAALVWIDPASAVVVVGVLVIAGVTDVLDGWVARRDRARRQAAGEIDPDEGIGPWLDPVCDKIFVVSVLAAIWVATAPPVLLMVLILMRDLILGLAALVALLLPRIRHRLEPDFHATRMGKHTTVAQFIAIGGLVAFPPVVLPAALLASAIGAAAALAYLRAAFRLVPA